MNKFKFDLGSCVVIAVSGETGTVLGRAEYLTSENYYMVRYRNALGQATEGWWFESALIDRVPAGEAKD